MQNKKPSMGGGGGMDIFWNCTITVETSDNQRGLCIEMKLTLTCPSHPTDSRTSTHSDQTAGTVSRCPLFHMVVMAAYSQLAKK